MYLYRVVDNEINADRHIKLKKYEEKRGSGFNTEDNLQKENTLEKNL